MLKEYIDPGTSLRDEKSLNKRLDVFCRLYQRLHIQPINASFFPTYTHWVRRITAYMAKREDAQEFYLHMKRGLEMYEVLTKKYAKLMLLHGDFHHDNISLNADGTYNIIDPKGVIGDPIFDIPRFLLNEYVFELDSNTYYKVNKAIMILENTLHVPLNSSLNRTF